MRKAEKRRRETKMFRAALAQAGAKPEELLREQEDFENEEIRLQKLERRLKKEKRDMKEGLMKERNHLQKRFVAMAAWEEQLAHRTKELAIRTHQFTSES